MNVPGLCIPPPPSGPQAAMRSPAYGVAHRYYYWDKDDSVPHWRNVSVRFMETDVPERCQRIREVIEGPEGWNSACGVQFVFDNADDAPVRITFAPGSSWSQPGNYGVAGPFDQPTMNFGWLHPTTPDAEWQRVILHEFGHALGLQHEHLHPGVQIPWDYEAVYAFYRQTNGWPPDLVDSQVLTPLAVEMAITSDFDKHSAMAYSIPPELLLDSAWQVPHNQTLSDGDRTFARLLYGPPPALPQTHTYLPTVRA